MGNRQLTSLGGLSLAGLLHFTLHSETGSVWYHDRLRPVEGNVDIDPVSRAIYVTSSALSQNSDILC
ncbi:hypothetical protein BYT27DRAFT_7300667 [Phlegmacium glaucopus]|nr:hypothetical protein BYT27DRAFT_7300667 [Phlegmacium glaucopus]